MFLVVRAAGDPKAVTGSLRTVVQGLDRDMPFEMRSMNDLLADSVAQPRFRTLLLGTFAAMALILAGGGNFWRHGLHRQPPDPGNR